MKHFCYTLIFLFIIGTVVSQEKVFELEGAFSSNKYSQKDSYALPNQENNDLMIITQEGQVTSAILLDNEYKQKVKILTNPLPSKYKHLIGYEINKNIYSVLFTNDNNTKFAILQFDIDNKKSTQKQLDFKLKKEKYVETIIYKNQIYLLSVTKRSSDLNIYTFDEGFKQKKHTISLTDLEYLSSKTSGYRKKAYDLFIESRGSFNTQALITKIESGNPNVIETTSKKVKLYQNKNNIILSFDNSDKVTKLCFIDLDTYSLDYKAYRKPAGIENGFSESNSYIFDNKLFQIASSSQKMKFTVMDLSTEKIIKEYAVTKEDSITFKNSPIIQEGGYGFWGFSEDKIRKMEKTSKYLRKISNANLGISVYKVNNEYNIILGGTKQIASGGGAGFAPVFNNTTTGFVGVNGAVVSFNTYTVSFNPTFYGYYGYTNTKSTYINCLFDENFEHLEGDIQKNTFDKVNEFEDNLEKDPDAVNIFLHNNTMHYGYYDEIDNFYKLFRFE